MKSSSSITSSLPFGDYFVHCFQQRYPGIASMLQTEQTAFAANVYLFRFDKSLSFKFVHDNLDAMSRSIADISGTSVTEARRLFTSSARDAARSYFEGGWEDVTRFVVNNASSLLNLQRENTRHSALVKCMQGTQRVQDVDPIMLERLFDNDIPVLVFVYAEYCSLCKAARPVFDKVADDLHDDALLVSFNGPAFPHFKDQSIVKSYPTILRYGCRDSVPDSFSLAHQFSFGNVKAFAKGASLQPNGNGVPEAQEPDVTDDPFFDALDSPRRNRLIPWAPLLRQQGIDELDVLAAERQAVMHSKIDMAIQCGDNSCDVLPHRSHNVEDGDPLPMCVLLGGGMGAGKTTVVGLIGATRFWEKYGKGVVKVEADAFKLSDPLFLALQSVTSLASRIVHRDSIVAAEELFLKAVNSRRDVVFDGTLSWGEYAKQTIDMLRDSDYYYKRGLGYIEQENGEAVEQYWVRADKRDKPAVAYRVELVGVTAEADISVMRGIVRKISTGRGVPVRDQLKSHALFSQNFEEYVDIVDSVYLFDTTMPSLVETAKQEYVEQLVAVKPGLLFDTPHDVDQNNASAELQDGKGDGNGGQFTVRFVDAYKRFLRKKFLNTEACRSSDLFVEVAVER